MSDVPAALHFGAVDAITIAVAIGIVLVKIGIRRWRSEDTLVSRELCGADFLNGTVVVPFLTMAAAVFDPPVYDEMLRTNAAFVSIAGVIGVLFVVGELLKVKAEKPAKQPE